MNREKLIEKAKKWHWEHLPLEKDDWAPSERLAEFAAEVLAERDAEIADELDKCCKQVPKGYRIAGRWMPADPMPSPCDLLFFSVRNLIDRLQGKQ